MLRARRRELFKLLFRHHNDFNTYLTILCITYSPVSEHRDAHGYGKNDLYTKRQSLTALGLAALKTDLELEAQHTVSRDKIDHLRAFEYGTAVLSHERFRNLLLGTDHH